MIESPTVHLEYTDDGRRTKVLYTNGDSEVLFLKQIGSDLFLLEESSLLGHANYHDAFRATVAEDGSLKFSEVVKSS